jgi:hypothetical protein
VPAASSEDRSLLAWTAAAAAGLLAAFAAPLALGRVYVLDDLGSYYLIARAFFRDCLVRGDSAVWWPDLDAGLYLHGLGQLGLYHPLRWLAYRALPLPWSFGLELVASYPVFALGAYWLLRRLELPRAAAVFGASLAAFSGFALLHHVHPNVVAVAAHIPWLVALLDVALRDARPRRRGAAWIGVAVLTGSQLLLHFPQVVVMSVWVEASYVAAVGLARRSLVRALPAYAAAKVLGVALGAVQWLPSLDYLQHTVRGDASLEVRFAYSLAPANLLQLVAPYLWRERYFHPPGEAGNLHELGVYAGAATLALAVWIAARLRTLDPPQRRVALGALALLAVAIDLSLGSHGLLFPLQARLPVLGLFRASARHVLLAHLALAVLGALAFEDLRRRRGCEERIAWLRLWPLALPTLLAVAAAALVPALSGSPTLDALASQTAGGWRPWLGPGLALAAAGLVALAARGARFALPALALFAAADQGAWGLSYAWREAPVAWSAFRTPPPELPPPDRTFRVHGGGTYFPRKTPNILALWGYRVANAYAGADALRALDYTTPKPLRIAGVEWIYRTDRPPHEILRLADPLPRVRLVSEAVADADPASALAAIDPAATAVVPSPLLLEPGPPGNASLVEDRPGRITVATEAPGRQLLVLAEKHVDGWFAAVDGEAAPVVRVYGDFLGAVVEAGRHEVRFRFDPASLRIGRAVSLAAAALALALGLGLAWRRPPGRATFRRRGGARA